jgi:hypothetical protein
MRSSVEKALIVAGILTLLWLPVGLTACAGSSNQQSTPSTSNPSEEASENDSIESTREEGVEQQNGSEEASENDSIESTREEGVEASSSTAP